MKKLVLVALLLSGNVYAQCIGSGRLQSCWDDNGNEYTVTRMGNTTMVDGYNSQTGSNWSSTSQTIGNTTYQSGTDSLGRQWDQTIQTRGNSTTYSGTDSNGNSFYTNCITNFDGSRSCY